MKKQEIFDFGKKIFNLLSPKGKWIIHVPNAESSFGNRILAGDFTHETAFTKKSLNQLLTCIGFKKNLFFEDTPAVYGLKSGIQRIFWQVIRLLLKAYLLVETGSRDGIFSQNLLAIVQK